MKQFKVKTRTMEFLFGTIEAARNCREKLMNMGYHEISIIVQEEDLNPYNE